MGSVERIQFIRTADPSDVWVAIDGVIDRECVVSRYSKTVCDALISKSLDDIVDHPGCFPSRRPGIFLFCFCHRTTPFIARNEISAVLLDCNRPAKRCAHPECGAPRFTVVRLRF